MFLPGMQYQDESWRHCKAALSLALMQACRQCQDITFIRPAAWVAGIEHRIWSSLWPLRSRLLHVRNRDGKDGFELCQDLLIAWLTPGEAMREEWWAKLKKTSAGKGSVALRDDQLRKLCGDMWSQFRDEVDVQHYIAATGDDFSVNQLQNLRKVDMADRAVKAILLHWREQAEYTGRILGREIRAEPIEAGRIKGGGRCAAQWLLNWSEHHAAFHPDGKVGPFHTKSKRFTASIKNLEQMLDTLDTRNGRWAGMGTVVSLDSLLPILHELEQKAVPANGPGRITPPSLEGAPSTDGSGQDDAAAEETLEDSADDAEMDNKFALDLTGTGEDLPDLTELGLFAPGKLSVSYEEPEAVLAKWALPVQLAAWLELALEKSVAQEVIQAFLAETDVPPEWGLRPERPKDWTMTRLRSLLHPPQTAANFAAAVALAKFELSSFYATRGGKESDHD